MYRLDHYALAVNRVLEFWPDYGGALLWDEQGRQVALESLPVAPALREAATRWVSEYQDSKLPWESTADPDWLARGRTLVRELRLALSSDGIEIRPHEDYWEPEQDDSLT